MSFRIDVQITPNAPKSTIVGWMGDRLKIKVKAPPVEGKANEELVRFIADHLDLRASAVTLVRGSTARLKTIEINGPEELRERLSP